MTDITHANWFGGYYQDVRNQFATFAVDPESWLRIYPKEFDLPEEQKKAWFADRTGAIVGADTAKNTGSRSASASRSRARSTAGPTAARGSSRSTASTIRRSRARTRRSFFFNYQFLRETIPEPSGFRDRYNWYVFTIADPGSRAGDRGEDRRDVRQLAVETKTEHRKGVRLDWAKQVGDIGSIMMWIVAMAMFTILLVAGNTMAQAIRERTNELAVLKTLGFGEGRILRMVLLESTLIALVGGGWAWRSSYAVHHHDGRSDRRIAAGFLLPDAGCSSAASAWSLALGLGAGSCPRWQASRLRIVDALRRN